MNFTLLDLTHSLHPNMAHWDIGCGFQSHTDIDYTDCKSSTKFKVQSMQLKCGIGTHIDAPSHCIQNGKNVDEIELTSLIVPCVVIDLSNKIGTDDYIVTIDDIIGFEHVNGVILNNSFVIIRTGWDIYWNNPVKYRNELIFPSINADVAKYLLNRSIAGLGVDTLSPDTFNSEFPVHKTILGANKYIVENIANSSLMPPIGSHVIILPIKIKDGTEAPARLVGLIGKE
jgi:kynurenine formamidase